MDITNGSKFRKYYKLPLQKNFGTTTLQVHEHSYPIFVL